MNNQKAEEFEEKRWNEILQRYGRHGTHVDYPAMEICGLEIDLADIKFLVDNLDDEFHLHVDGPKTVDVQCAREFARYEGVLEFESVSRLSDAAATELARFRGRGLNMQHLSELPDSTAHIALVKVLCCKRSGLEIGEELQLNELTLLHPRIAETISRYANPPDHLESVSLNGLLELSEDSARILGHSGLELNLNGLRNLPSNVAEGLGMSNNLLELNGIRQISREAAENLTKHPFSISLNGLTSISEDVAAGLGAGNVPNLTLDGLKELCESEASVLVGNKPFRILHLNGLTSISESVAECLAIATSREHGDKSPYPWLYLNGLESLPEDVAAALSKQCGVLSLNGLRTISDKAAAAIGKHRGVLYLDNVEC